MKTFRTAALAALALAASGHAAAAAFTDGASFAAAVAGMAIRLETFATLPVGTIINSGDRINDITYDFQNDQGGIRAKVGIVDCVSGHCLSKETTEDIEFSGDEGRFQFSFATPVNAVGVVRFSSTHNPFGLFSIGAASEEAFNPDGVQANFLGIVSPTAFTSVVFRRFREGDCGFFGCPSTLYVIPAIVYATAVPEPEPYLLLAAGLLVLAWPARRRA